MRVFSFCLYGTERNYYTGLLENIEIIKQYYPDFTIVVHKGFCDPSWVIPEGVEVNITNREGAINALLRYLSLLTADIGFVRDTDSRITARDRWCIDEFLKSSKSYHSIRDHYWHSSKIMAGTFGWKKPFPLMIPTHEVGYGFDEQFLEANVYEAVKADMLVHTCNRAYVGEYAKWIERPHEDAHDFVGNVIWDGKPKFAHMFDTARDVDILQQNDQFELVKRMTDSIDPLSIPWHQRWKLYDSAYRACVHVGDLKKAQFWMAAFEFADISPHIMLNSNYIIPMLGKVVASFDSKREPKEDEVVIVYGDYPDWHRALPGTNKMYRHVSFFYQLKHDVVESHPCWDSVDVIYILNLEQRVDRYMETLSSLARVAAPLHKIHHYKAQTGGPLSPYTGATKNHVDVMQHFENNPGLKTCLIVEDDIVFTDDVGRVQSSIAEFFRRPYEYTMCFLSLARFETRVPHDDLLSISKQPCTTSSAYFLHKPTSAEVLRVAREGLDIMISTGGQNSDACIDRYWCFHLPMIHFFKDKLAYQRPSYSNLMGTVIANLD
jgi:hypothetical protein